MKKSITRLMGLILAAVLVTGCLAGYGTVTAATDYNKYSGAKKSWYIMRNGHKAPGGADKASKLRKYNAYYYDSKTKDKVIYFTFDCGYENGYTKKILDTLKKHDVKATFFVTKGFVASNAKLCKRMKKEGHFVGNHTLSHPSLPTISLDKVKSEVNGLADLFKEKTGYDLDLYIRPPMGEYSNRVLKLLSDMGYKTIFWSIAYMDYDVNKQPGKQYVIDHFNKYHHKGAITLTHNTSKSNCEALDSVLTNLEKKGYRFGTLDELQ
jgi:peptidoglycan-N-acetylmuramic acid deacetylase